MVKSPFYPCLLPVDGERQVACRFAASSTRHAASLRPKAWSSGWRSLCLRNDLVIFIAQILDVYIYIYFISYTKWSKWLFTAHSHINHMFNIIYIYILQYIFDIIYCMQIYNNYMKICVYIYVCIAVCGCNANTNGILSNEHEGSSQEISG